VVLEEVELAAGYVVLDDAVDVPEGSVELEEV